VDDANYEKLNTYLRSYKLREEGMCSNVSYLLWTVLITLELRAEGHKWFDDFPQTQEPELEMELDTWRSMFTRDSFELGIKTTITTSRELGHNETTEMSYGVTRQLLLVTSAIKNTLYLGSGMEVLDASCGAAVTCLGYDNLEQI